MSDYEMADSFSSMFSGLQMLFTSYVSIIFAFLIASWLVAHKINTVMAAICLFLFTLVSIYFISFTFFIAQDMLNLGKIIGQKVEAGESSLSWTGFGDEWDDPPPLMNLLLFMELAAYIASLLFFYYQRKSGKVDRQKQSDI